MISVSGIAPWHGRPPRSAVSLAVSTSATPGIAAALAASVMRKRACAWGERRTTAWSTVGGMVGDVAAGAADESVVLFARERPAETELGRWHGRAYSAGAGGASGARRRRRAFSAIQRQTT